jgi:AAA ATPase domain
MEQSPLGRLASGRFVGREAALSHLREGIAQSLGGRPAWFLLTGEAGIGKSRTAEEVAAEARGLGFAVHRGRCPEVAGAPPYRPWLQILRSLQAELGEEGRAALRGQLGPGTWAVLSRLVPELAPDALAEATEGGAEARFRLFEAVAALLAAAAHRIPQALLFEDLQRADEASLALLGFCARELGAARLLVVATCREDEAAGAWGVAASAAALRRSFREVPLTGLASVEIRDFLATLLGRDPGDAFVAAARERSEGNPLFLTELARLLVLQNRLDPPDPDAVRELLPSSVREVMRQRLARLSRDCRRALACGAVVGREFNRDLLDRVLDPPLASAAGTLLDEARAARVVGPAPGATAGFRFAHALIRDVLYEDLALDDRSELHARVLDALLALHPLDPESVIAALAHHSRAALAVVGPSAAAHWTAEAARDAARRLAFDDASSGYRSALDLLARVAPAGEMEALERERRAGELRLELARATERAGDAAEARALYLEAAAGARRLGDTDLLARAALGFAGPRVGVPAHAPDRENVALLEEALRGAAPERFDLRVPLLGRLAMELHFSPDTARRDALAHEAVELARRAADPALLSEALTGAIWATWSPDNPEWRRDAASEVIERGSDRFPDLTIGARAARAVAHLELGNVRSCDEDIAAGDRASVELHYEMLSVFFRSLQAMRAILEGRLSEAEVLAAEALARGLRAGSPHSAGVHASQLTLIRCEQGRAAELERGLGAFARGVYSPKGRANIAWLRVQLSQHSEARRELRALLARDLEDLPRDFFWLGTLALLAEASVALDQRRAVRLIYDRLLPYAARTVVIGMSAGCLGSASRHLGLLAASLGRYDAAELHFEAALDANRRLGALPLLAHTQEDLAAMLRVRAGPGDVERAEKLEDEAISLRAELSVGDAARRATRVPKARAEPEDAELAWEKGTWRVRFAGSEGRVRDARGVRYLALLLEHPDQELHVLDLVARAGGAGAIPEGGTVPLPMADARARNEYRERVEQLRAEIDLAEARNDLGQAERARAELEAIERALAAAFGLGGRSRPVGDPAERARKAVYNRLRTAIRAFQEEIPALGRHLAGSVRTGTYCAYRPERTVHWSVRH